MVKENDKDKVVYFPGKPGFYKKGPLHFRLDFGTIEELQEDGRKMKKAEKAARKQARRKASGLRAVPDEKPEEAPGPESEEEPDEPA